jgi:Transposase domain (DUF772)
MMGRLDSGQDKLFYSFNLDSHVPQTHLLRGVDQALDLGNLRQHLAPFYGPIGRPSIDPEFMIRMLIVGYCFGIRSERRLCEEVHLNLGPFKRSAGNRTHRLGAYRKTESRRARVSPGPGREQSSRLRRSRTGRVVCSPEDDLPERSCLELDRCAWWPCGVVAGMFGGRFITYWRAMNASRVTQPGSQSA